MQNVSKLPILYISHSGPTAFFDQQSTHNKQLQTISKYIDQFRANVMTVIFISAHYNSKGKTKILANDHVETIHDHGYSECFDFHYSPRGSPSVAQEIHSEFKKAGLNSELDSKWGADHAVWMVMAGLYPKPQELKIVVISIDMLSGEQNIRKIGQTLYQFREKGCLIIGSGTITHNFALWRAPPGPRKDALQRQNDDFTKWVDQTLLLQGPERTETLMKFRQNANFKAAQPSDDHWLPIIAVLGATENLKSEKLFQGVEFGAFVCNTYAFT